MASTFELNIITPDQVFYTGEVTMVTAPGVFGEFGVLAGHAPFVSTLKPGIVRIERAGTPLQIAVLGGVAEVTQEHCSILAEVAQSLENMTQVDAQAQLQSARDAYESAHNDEVKARAAERLQLAEIITKAA